MDRVGRKRLQWVGSAIIGVLYTLLGTAFDELVSVPALFLILYGCTFLFSNFGPNATTYVIPGEFFPAEVRATCHGLAAASGKIGAAVAAYSFPPLKDSIGIGALLIACGIVAFIGVVWTWLFVPDYRPDTLQGALQEKLDEFLAEQQRLLHAENAALGRLGAGRATAAGPADNEETLLLDSSRESSA